MRSMNVLVLLVFPLIAEPPTVRVDRDNVEIAKSCRVVLASNDGQDARTTSQPDTARVVADADNAICIADADNNGIIRITGDDIVVDFNPCLDPDTVDAFVRQFA